LAASNGIERFEGGGEHRDTSSAVQAAIVMCGSMNMLADGVAERAEAGMKKPEGSSILDFMGGVPPSRDPARCREASPLTHVGKHTPPMLFIDGEKDRPRLRCTEFRAKMDELAIEHEFVMMPGAPHPFWSMREWFGPTVEAVDGFLKKQFGPEG
jgi:pectinesterase